MSGFAGSGPAARGYSSVRCPHDTRPEHEASWAITFSKVNTAVAVSALDLPATA